MNNDFKCNEFNNDLLDLDNICEDCNKENETVSQNLILTGFKRCESCRLSKTISRRTKKI